MDHKNLAASPKTTMKGVIDLTAKKKKKKTHA